ncbi:hypothetical protein [Streptomyces sp. NPDC059802]|uniref:hypothetical protein n=1 Tax=Streptomyces sp. NPDC059802 TaxID=3346952 RepID=UPI00366866C2
MSRTVQTPWAPSPQSPVDPLLPAEPLRRRRGPAWRPRARIGAGTFDASFRCHRIRRSIDNSYRYNEIIGILTDYAHGETCNEALLAIAAGGLRALTGYATACAHVVDDVLACDCGEDGHEEVAETAMGALAWYLVTPRYGVRAQLHALSTTGGDLQRAFPLSTAKGPCATGRDL